MSEYPVWGWMYYSWSGSTFRKDDFSYYSFMWELSTQHRGLHFILLFLFSMRYLLFFFLLMTGQEGGQGIWECKSNICRQSCEFARLLCLGGIMENQNTDKIYEIAKNCIDKYKKCWFNQIIEFKWSEITFCLHCLL